MKLFILLSCLPVFGASAYVLLVRKHLSRTFRAFTPFLVVSGGIQLISMLLWLFSIKNLPLLHVYVPVGFCCLIWFYKHVFKQAIHPLILPVTACLFVLFSLINTLFFQDLFTYNSSALLLESVLVIILTLSSFLLAQHAFVQEDHIALTKGLNWIHSGLLIYFFSSSLVYHYGESITQLLPTELARYVWALHSIFSMVMYSFFIVGIWKSMRK